MTFTRKNSFLQLPRQFSDLRVEDNSLTPDYRYPIKCNDSEA